MMKSSTDFFYFLSETHYFQKDYSVLGVTFVGTLTLTHRDAFQNCTEQVSKSLAKFVIFNFRDVTIQLDPNFLPLIQKLLITAREKPAFIRLSGVHPDLRKVFHEHKFVQEDELVNNLADALNSLPPLDLHPKKVT